jgi:hypothetical protein
MIFRELQNLSNICSNLTDGSALKGTLPQTTDQCAIYRGLPIISEILGKREAICFLPYSRTASTEQEFFGLCHWVLTFTMQKYKLISEVQFNWPVAIKTVHRTTRLEEDGSLNCSKFLGFLKRLRLDIRTGQF